MSLGVAALVVGASVAVQAPLFVPDREASGSGPQITVLQANLLLGQADPSALVAHVRDARVDVLTVNELTAHAVTRLGSAGIDAELPYRFLQPRPDGGGTGIWSRHPLSDGRALDQFELASLSARVDVPGAPNTLVFALHPVPPWPYPPRIWSGDLQRWHALLGSLPDDSAPVIVSGDFNATYDHARYRALLGDRFRDAADETGAGILNTYPADRWFPPLIAIDHVLVHNASARHIETVDLPGSDHRGLLARITLEPRASRSAAG
jgi:endonuclease/exonuclease/phosphatase (EEP) superfamily protein YafD